MTLYIIKSIQTTVIFLKNKIMKIQVPFKFFKWSNLNTVFAQTVLIYVLIFVEKN